jgi:hypothetical protein
MEAELKNKWISALRSGEYKQCSTQLRDEKDGVARYCCLGVLCDIINPDAWGGLERSNWFGRNDDDGPPSEGGYLSDEMCEEVGLDKRVMFDLTVKNDDGAPFGEIADIIEREVA